MDLAIQLEGVWKQFGKHTAVADLSLAVPRGAVYGLLGPNGSGKTTSIRMIMGILLPDRGRVTLFGGDPDEPRRKRVGYLPEERGLYRKMKVEDVIVFLGEIRGVDAREARRRARTWIDRLELGAWAGKRVEDLSKGMQQKVQFIGTVVHEPELLILDEPFSGLDPINQDVLESIVLDYKQKGTTILFSTHLMEQAERMCDAVCLISHSQKVLDGDLRSIKRAESRGVIAVEYEGSDDWIERGSEVLSIERTRDDGVHLLLRDGADAQALLRRAVADHVVMHRFERVEPRLHEIFVKHAGRRGQEVVS
ncbi:MAG: ATP-binding cassette domain-containing protein [Gemmatimonadota bacterium]|nr:ATP-binding cassette domain-containing protein [Gemmatimonadota bacterium]